MYSWTQDEYLAAIANQVFYSKVMDFFVATNAFEVNDEGGDDVELSDDDTKKLALALKFYYAGGSCRFMFQYPTEGVKTILERAVHSAASKTDLVKYCNGAWHTDSINRLYGMQPDSPCGGRFPVSSYAAALLAKETGPDEISWLMNRLNASNNRAVNGHLLEWLFLAATPQRSVELVGTVENILTRAKVLQFDPKKPFKTVEMKRRYPGVVSACHPNGTYDIEYDNGKKDTDVDVELLHKNGSDSDDNVKQKKFKEGDKVEIHFQSNFEIRGNWKLLQPVVWYQGSYDMLYFSTDARKVTFIQVARSDKLHLKMRYFHEVLLKLDQAGMIISGVVIYFVVKSTEYYQNYQVTVEDRGLLASFNSNWTCPEEDFVKKMRF
ncbi:hypothetical protein PI124_g1083 [Phytophthora idaei]|nr:hypothetical protein PI125_g1367 [Phytophthora idaei]KAG3170664.1 hypothetical protein PI126_g2249 [Phytophthora idaei]KAG3254344.1 hypothetical protein PI124_g1083 [Phytophthora idaei]